MKKKVATRGIITISVLSIWVGICGCGDTAALEDLSAVTENTEDQSSYYPGNSIASTENGYYMWDVSGSHLLFFDKETKKQVLLCNKPDCEHKISSSLEIETGEDCNSYFSSEYVMNKIWAYGDSLLVLQQVSGEGLYLTQISSDGSIRKPLVCLSDNTKEDVSLIVHEGYAYFSKGASEVEEGTKELYKVELKEGAEPEKIDEITGSIPLITHIKGYGNQIYYVTFRCEDYDVENALDATMYYQLKKYDTSTMESSLVSEESIDDYVVDEEENILYYHVCGGDVYKMNLADSSIESIYQDSDLILCRMAYDGEYVYVDNFQSYISGAAAERKVCAIGEDGTIAKEIATNAETGNSLFEYGDGAYMFCLGTKDWLVLNKKEAYVQTGKSCDAWELLPLEGTTTGE